MATLLIAAALFLWSAAASAEPISIIVSAATYLGASAATATALGYLGTAATVLYTGYSLYSTLSNRPDKQRIEGPRLGDVSIQSSTRGAPLPKVWGSMRIAGNLIDGKKYEERTEETIEGGGKGFMGGGGGGSTQVTYKYYADFAVSLCEGPITGVRRIWMNNKLWYHAGDDASETELEASADHERYGKLYLGTSTQNPDPTLEAIHGAGNVPPYRHTAYIVFTRLPLENFGNAIPNVSVEVCNTPRTFTAPTIHPGAEDGGTSGTNMVRDPETGRIFKTTLSDTYLRVFNSALSSSIRLITLPDKASSEVVSTPCYVPTTREIWAPYNTVAGASLAIIDPDALVIKATLTMAMATPGPAFYNPVKDEVVVHDQEDGTKTLYFNPQTRVGVAGPNLFETSTYVWSFKPLESFSTLAGAGQRACNDLALNPGNEGQGMTYEPPTSAPPLCTGWWFGSVQSGLSAGGSITVAPTALCFGCLYIAPHEAIAVWGSDNRIRLVNANTYGLIADYDASEFGMTKNWVSYDSKRDVLYWCCGATTISRNLYTIDLDPLYHGGTPVLGSSRTLPYDPRDGMCWVKSTDRIYLRDSSLSGADIFGLDPVTLAEEDSIDGVTLTKTGLYPIDGKRFIVAGDYHKVPIRPLLPNSGVPLSQIVQDLCKDAGLALADLNTVALTDTVHGYVRAQPMEAAAAIAPLTTAFLFDCAESDYLLTFPKRGGSSVVTIPEDDLATREGGQEMPAPVEITRAQEIEMPNAVSVRYVAYQLDYQQGTKIDKRVITKSVHTVQLDLPIALSHTKARRLARVLMDNAWTERMSYRFSVGIDQIKLDPADVVKVEADNATHLLRLTKVDFGSPGILQCEGLAERVTLLPVGSEKAEDLAQASIYEEGDETPEPEEIPPAELAPVPNTRLLLLDLPIFLDQHNDPGFYYAMCGFVSAGWSGGVLFKSTDSGATYAVLDAMTTPAAIGTATTALASGTTTIWDNGSTVNVYLTQGTLASDTEANVLAGANIAALGAHGRWEIIQWQTATLESDGTYTLSNLLRGRKGSEHAIGSHQIGDTFVALSTATVDRAATQSAELGLERYYKGASIGGSLAEASAQKFTNTGVGLECYSPVNLKGTRVASGDLTITWIRRTRAQGEWRDLVDVPLFEDSEKYDLEILNGGVVVRTWTDLTTASQVYSSANQVTDFGANQAAVSVRVYQKSTLAGRGYPGSATV